MTDCPQGNSPPVSFVASQEFIDALDLAAAQYGQTRSHYARHILAQHLRATGLFPPDGAVTHHDVRRHRRRMHDTV